MRMHLGFRINHCTVRMASDMVMKLVARAITLVSSGRPHRAKVIEDLYYVCVCVESSSQPLMH